MEKRNIKYQNINLRVIALVVAVGSWFAVYENFIMGRNYIVFFIGIVVIDFLFASYMGKLFTRNAEIILDDEEIRIVKLKKTININRNLIQDVLFRKYTPIGFAVGEYYFKMKNGSNYSVYLEDLKEINKEEYEDTYKLIKEFIKK